MKTFKKYVVERSMTSRQKLVQMQHYWDDLDHLASDETKKKSMKMRFGIRNIKLDKKGGKLIDFDEDIEEFDPEINELYKDYPGKGWLMDGPDIKPKDIIWRSKVHHWDNTVRSDNTRFIITKTGKGKDKFQMWAVSDKSGDVVFHFGDKPTLDDAKEFASIRKWQEKK